MSEFTVVKTELVQDYIDFINALNYKFQFKNKDIFEEEFLKVVEKINPDGLYDAGEVFSKFVELIKKHSTNNDLKENAKKAVEELRALGKLNGNRS